MALLPILIALVVVGIILWAINSFIPMDAKIKKILNIVVVIVLILWLFNIFGLFDYLGTIHI